MTTIIFFKHIKNLRILAFNIKLIEKYSVSVFIIHKKMLYFLLYLGVKNLYHNSFNIRFKIVLLF